MSASNFRCQCEVCRAADWEVISGQKRAEFAELLDAAQAVLLVGSIPSIDFPRLKAAVEKVQP
jgi:hypothetical protein